MNTRLKADIEKAIDDAIQNGAENDLWENYIHPELASQMANACEAVFDSAQKAQEYLKAESK